MTDLSAELGAQLSLQLGQVKSSLAQAEERWRRCMGAIQQVPVVSNFLAGNGVIDQPDALMAKTGYIWSLRRLACSGFTAGTVTVYKNSALTGAEPVAIFTAAPQVQTWGRGAILLMPGERLVLAGTGITGGFQVQGAADCFEQWYLPIYIG